MNSIIRNMGIAFGTVALAMATPKQAEAQQAFSEAVAQENLAKVPAADPQPTSVPSVIDAMKGQHPRLLFTSKEIAAFRTQVHSDPILKKTYDDISVWGKRMKITNATQLADVVRSDTPAITSVKSWPGLAYVYAIDHDPGVKQAIIDYLNMLLDQPYWATASELDSSMGAGDNMLVAGLLFDSVCNDLAPELRLKIATRMLTQVRRMYYLGHKQLSLCPIKYWQQDTQNNHRWHRDAGCLACLLSIADMKELPTGYMMEQFKNEMDYLMKWLPPDGDDHEGAGYQVFGFQFLALAANMMDRVVGTDYLKNTGFRNSWAQQLYYSAPGRLSDISFGDDMNSEGPFDAFESGFFMGPHLTRDVNVQAALVHRFMQRAKPLPGGAPNRVYTYPWTLLAFYDPTVGQGNYNAVPTYRIFPDMGAVSMRDSWEDNAFCFTFKCGPYGGCKLNEYAAAEPDKEGFPKYVNTAHDDPDANEFALGTAGEFLFHPGLYSLHKITSNHSTVTIGGTGQINEGTDFLQPVHGVDMRKLAYLTGWKVGDKGRIIVEGEAGNTYQALKPGFEWVDQGDRILRIAMDKEYNPILKRFRRTAAWMPGDYILILDDLIANGKQPIVWRGTVEKGMVENAAEGRCYVATKGGKRLDFQILANHDFNGAIDHEFLDGRFANALVQQFRFSLDTDAVKFACILDPWKRKLTMKMKENGDNVIITVHSDNFDDTWTWAPPKDSITPSSLEGKRGPAVLVSLTDKDKAPHD